MAQSSTYRKNQIMPTSSDLTIVEMDTPNPVGIVQSQPKELNIFQRYSKKNPMKCACAELICVYTFFIGAIVMMVFGGIDIDYGMDYPYVDSDLAESQSITRQFCYQNNCTLSSLKMSNLTCADFNTFMEQQSTNIDSDCRDACNWKSCSFIQSSECLKTCVKTWATNQHIRKSTGVNGRKRYSRGIALVMCGIVSFFIPLLIFIVLVTKCND